jgi:type I restriction enzyme M protein
MLNKNRLENLANDVWKGAEKLRGKFKARDYSAIILPMIMLRRIECVLEQKREAYCKQIVKQDASFSEEAIAELQEVDSDAAKEKRAELNSRIKLLEVNKGKFYNESNWTLRKVLKENAQQIESNFREFLNSFSDNIDDIIDNFDYRNMVTRMAKANRLASIIQLVAEKDFSPDRLSNLEMGYVYEHLLQKFTEDDANDTGEHFTPREIIRIMVDLMEIDFDPETSKEAISIYDPASGTGGMLSIAKEHLVEKVETPKGIENTEDLVLLNGQEILPQNYAICKADMIIKGGGGQQHNAGQLFDSRY